MRVPAGLLARHLVAYSTQSAQRASAPYRPSLHTQCTLGWDSVFRTCIVHSVRLFFWPLLPILGEFLHSAPASCIGTLSALSWLWVSFCIPHSASCILHVSHSCSFGPASAFCILHLHPASGAVHSFGADSAFCILHLHPAWVAVHSLVWARFCILHSASASRIG